MQEENIQPVHLQQAKAGFNRLAHHAVYPVWRRVAQIALAGDVDSSRQAPAEGLADNPLRLAIAVTRRKIEQIDSSHNPGMDGRDTFLERRLAPQHAQTATAQGQGRDRKQGPEGMQFHAANFHAKGVFWTSSIMMPSGP